MTESRIEAPASTAGGETTSPPVADLIGGRPSPRAGAATWLERRRAEALERANALSVPTTRDEDWRFTDLTPLTRRSWQPAAPDADYRCPVDDVSAWALPESQARLVFVDGVYQPSLSIAAPVGAGDGSRPASGGDGGSGAGDDGRPRGAGEAFLGTLDAALLACGPAVERHLTRLAGLDRAFTAINTAFLQDAAIVVIPRNVAGPAPLHVLHVATRAGSAQYARLLVVAEPGSDVTVVEEYAAATDADCFVNAVTEIAVGDGARVRHVRVQADAVNAFHIASAAVSLGRDASYESQSVALGARISRYEPEVRLAGTGARIVLDGLALIGGRQVADTHSFVDHAVGDCRTRQSHRCIVDGGAHAVFNGKIVVRPGAQRTDSSQESRNLLLSPRAQVDTKPQLEIFADDVKCAHGAAVGQIDAEQLFYIESRGLSPRTARNLLTYAFAASVFGRIPVASLRRRLEQRVLARTQKDS